MHFKEDKPDNFLGNIEQGEKCYIQKGNLKTFVNSKVKVNKKILITEDSGYEQKTGKKIWGSNFGPLVFKKIKDFDDFIDKDWG